jgi:hypothetical protein
MIVSTADHDLAAAALLIRAKSARNAGRHPIGSGF